MSDFTRIVRSHHTLISVLFALALVAVVWNSHLSHKVTHVVGLTGAVVCAILISFVRLWTRLWFWATMAAFVAIHTLAWWVILNTLLATTNQLFLGTQVAAGFGEAIVLFKVISALER